MKKIFASVILLTSVSAFSQVTTFKSQYFASSSEMIFSAGSLGNTLMTSNTGVTTMVKPDVVPRFSAFFHFGEQLHFNFTNSFGIYTGLNLRNTGFINRFSDTIRVKQRVYSLGVPLAVKLGNMGKKAYLAFGAEAEFFLNYKQKTFLGSGRGEKVEKFNEWFSDRTELFNPSVFLELNFGKGTYIRFKYYLNNFLVAGNQNFSLDNDMNPQTGVSYTFVPGQSQLFSFSIGKVTGDKRTASKKPTETRYF